MGPGLLIYRTFSFSVHSKFLKKHRKKSSLWMCSNSRVFIVFGIVFYITSPRQKKNSGYNLPLFCFSRCDTTEKLRNTLDYLRSLLNDSTNFKLIYRYAFDFARVSPLDPIQMFLSLPSPFSLPFEVCFICYSKEVE